MVVKSGDVVLAPRSPLGVRCAAACRVPGDKSISHRALLFGALCDGVVEASGLGRGGDNLSTAAALRALGVDVQLDAGQARIAGVGFAGLRAAAEALDCGNSGTTIRLLMGLLAGRPFETELRGDASLTRRPMGRVAAPLRQMGATIEGRSDPARPGDVYPPLRVRGGALIGIEHELKVASAQLKSALILAALQARGRTELREPARSRDHTERMLRFLGAPIAVARERRDRRRPDRLERPPEGRGADHPGRSLVGDVPHRRGAGRPRQRRRRRKRRPQPDARRGARRARARWAPI